MTTIAIQGICGSYSEEAAKLMRGSSVSLISCDDFERTFAAVISNEASMAVVPLRNKIVGEIKPVADLLRQTSLAVLEEFDLRIHHVLVGTSDAHFEDIVTIRSHPEAIKQCRSFFYANPQIAPVAGGDTASCIQVVANANDRQVAAIGSERAAKMYGAKIIRTNIADLQDNWTTFGRIGLS